MGSRHTGLYKAVLAAAAIAAGTLAATPSLAELKGLEIIAPASPGGGWDQHARTLQQVLQDQKLASGIQVANIPGAGGTIGLAQFVTAKKRSPAILVGGQIMLGAIVMNKSAVTLDQVKPLARLTGEYTAIVVPADSPIKSFGELLAKFKADPGSVSWGGGSAGGSDQILAGLIAKAAGVDPAKVNYVATAGGGELLASALGGHVTLGMGGYNEFAPQFQAGKLRAIAVSAPQRLAGRDTPTLKEQGVDLEFVNWRGVFAQAGAKPAEMKELQEALAKAVASPEWQDILKQRGWIDQYQPADQFAAFLKDERARIEGTLKDIGLTR
ncbi:Bug family tripartite tricarboxylate transporter substrate binding protein [Azospirillum picis]|uniref:Tricarboxylic transport membrane protein n=1 Tax=Azospirillum picis TaxID=488438 RepID=A0ABU0MCP6_9PROT|nr:tripartite tricarboxylate transporter substrate-binding protein [Azospirillum picis]MBP2297770.1 putative tricarboxylic transport membrane protein [Azospirillum picis]MDQ0531207.1 putative tricarboxylic transport membrane protein [Azospirillum picis]